jgi:hypothetical protein
MYPGSVYYAIKHQSNDNLLDMGVSLPVYENNTSVRTITTITLLVTLITLLITLFFLQSVIYQPWLPVRSFREPFIRTFPPGEPLRRK